jgi:hypothetical protein
MNTVLLKMMEALQLVKYLCDIMEPGCQRKSVEFI